MTYNPFGKSIDELTLTDLDVLQKNEVAEGYWIEYKREFPENRKVAKSIASFANTYGGWYFIGIKADKQKNIPTSICGFSLTDIPDPIDKSREVIKSRIDPTPVFYTKLISIDEDRAVLIIHVPDDQETPFITSDGRIYRREGDSSDPVSENNRHTVDRLFEKGRYLAQQFDSFCQDERAFSQAEKGGWVKVFLSPQPLGILKRAKDCFSSEYIEKMLELSRTEITASRFSAHEYIKGNLPFNYGRLTNRSVILRQANLGSISTNPVAVEFFFDGQAKFFIPLKYLSIERKENISLLRSQKAKQALLTIHDQEFYLLSFFDVKKLWNAIVILVSYYQTWLKQEYSVGVCYLTGFKAKVIIDDVWRNVAFFDADKWGNHVLEFGLPVMDRKTLSVSSDINKKLWNLISQKNSLGFLFGSSILIELGIPVDLLEAIADPSRIQDRLLPPLPNRT